jgi:hypothetical protein
MHAQQLMRGAVCRVNQAPEFRLRQQHATGNVPSSGANATIFLSAGIIRLEGTSPSPRPLSPRRGGTFWATLDCLAIW